MTTIESRKKLILRLLWHSESCKDCQSILDDAIAVSHEEAYK